jgi:hypothetical protein
VSILFAVPFVILDEAAAKTGDQFPQFLYLQPGFTTEFFPIVHGEDNGGLNPEGPQPGDNPQIPA